MAWDARDGYLLMFGGAANDGNRQYALDDTWAWTEDQWWRLTTPTSPPPRSFPAMAFDPRSGLVLMFGGGAANSDEFRNDTWAWNGITWVELHPTVSPRTGMANKMAYDSVQKSVLLVAQSPYPGDPLKTWSWSGETWTLVASGPDPSPRWDFALANGPITGEVLLIGGSYGGMGDPSYNKHEVWIWHGGAWTRMEPVGALPGGLVSAALDSSRHILVVFVEQLNETWQFDGSTWTRLVPQHGPPALLAFSAFGFDIVGAKIVLFGGKADSLGSQYINQTWLWDGADWTEA